MKSRYFACLRRQVALSMTVCLVLFLAACKPLDQAAGEQLAGAKKVLDAVQADYNAEKIPQTEVVYKTIATAVSVQNLAIDALKVYVTAKAAYDAAPGPESNRKLKVAEAALRAALKELADIVKQVKKLQEVH